MKEQLESIRHSALEAIAATRTGAELEALRVKYLGKKGELTAVLKQMGKLSPEERPVMGQMANDVRAALEQAIEAQSAVLAEKALNDRLEAEALDVTIPGKAVELGHKHPMYIALTRSRISSWAWASPYWMVRKWSWRSTTSTS